MKQHGSNLSNLNFPMYRSRQSITSSLSVASRSVVNRKKQRLVKVGTFNVRTLRTDFRAFELKKLAADLKIDVLVIQEHRRSKSDVDLQRSLPKRMAVSPWSSLRSRCWWYRLSSVVAVFALASRLQVRQ